MGHGWGTVEAQLGHKFTWGTVGEKAVVAQFGHNLMTDEKNVSWGTVGAQLRHIWGTHFSWTLLGQG